MKHTYKRLVHLCLLRVCLHELHKSLEHALPKGRVLLWEGKEDLDELTGGHGTKVIDTRGHP